MKKLTKKRSIELCLEMWTWLSKNPGSKKIGWPGMIKANDEYGYIDSECFACEYTRQYILTRQVEMSCKKCPLIKLWGKYKGNTPCIDSEVSPYYHWVYSKYKDTKSAKKIASYCRKLLKEMEKR